MFSFFKAKPKPGSPIFLTNTLSGEKERFAPMRAGEVRMYSCGPTVYGPQHVGNLRAAVFSDTLARTLSSAGYRVRRVVNITDVGHLVGDGDDGEDKMAVGAKRDHLTPKAIADKYTKQYLNDIRALNIDTNAILFPRATEHIKEQIEMTKVLESKGLAYRASDGVYFDTKRFGEYGKLGGVMNVKLKAGARVKMAGGKKNMHDFVLWRKAKKGDLQVWDSPWGPGNPGWSIECSAMIKATLGETIDIHTGGQDHIQVHHNNEIAQSEGANERPLARIWMHNAFLTIEGEKIAKSLGNTYVLEDIIKKGIHPLALRLFFMQAHYRTPLSFSFEAVRASEEALFRLWKAASEIEKESKGKGVPSDAAERIKAFLRDDLGTPQALAALFDALQDEELSARQKWGVLEAAEEVLGVSLTNPPQISFVLIEVHRDIQQLARERELARKEKDYARADELRNRIKALGYEIEDGEDGPRFTKI